MNRDDLLDGTLDVIFIDLGSGLTEPSLGDFFDNLTAKIIINEFGAYHLALLPAGLEWDVSYILDDFGTDFVRLTVSETTMPIPGAVWLLGSGIIAGLARLRQRPNK